jgi:hypothetical protein
LTAGGIAGTVFGILFSIAGIPAGGAGIAPPGPIPLSIPVWFGCPVIGSIALPACPEPKFNFFLKECEFRFNYGQAKQLLTTLKKWIKMTSKSPAC